MDENLTIIDHSPSLGPKSAQALQALTGQDLTDFKFMTGRFFSIHGVECHVARSGYTGEDGFEVSSLPCLCISLRAASF